jgi:hypothetical protein
LGASTAEAQVNVAKDIAVQMVDALENKAFVGVVNASNLAFLSRPDLATCISLAERLGALQGHFTPAGFAQGQTGGGEQLAPRPAYVRRCDRRREISAL